MPKTGWLSQQEWARSVANEILQRHKTSGVGTGARSGQHGTPYLRAAREINEIVRTGQYRETTDLLPEIRAELRAIADRWVNRGRELNHPGGRRR